jgi:hypothetical protein
LLRFVLRVHVRAVHHDLTGVNGFQPVDTH